MEYWRYSHSERYLQDFAPQSSYRITMQFDMDLVGESASAKFYAPKEMRGQHLLDSSIIANGLSINNADEESGHIVSLHAHKQSGHRTAKHSCLLQTSVLIFKLPNDTQLPQYLPDHISKYVLPTNTIQSQHQEIIQLGKQLVNNTQSTAEKIERMYSYVHQSIKNSTYENTLDALAVSKWKEAFCGGKSRLLIALLRSQNIPARVVGGVILKEGSKRKTHSWVECWVNGTWIPMDPTNGHWLKKPQHYLVLYHGDKSFIHRSEDINFQFKINIQNEIATSDQRLIEAVGGIPSLWATLDKINLDFDVLRILLLLPISVLLILFFRNVIGLESFGTFVPALLAVSFRDMGVVMGITLLMCVLCCGLSLRYYLEKLQLLNTPRLAILITSVIII
ncbi:MAG: hypothetical protein HRU15_02460, partial [Planctomycetes bacterium]|nr:hypothetical protein [Planctomycetota bacterium]